MDTRTSDEELRRMRLRLQKRERKRAAALAQRLEEARADARRIVEHVAQTYRPRRIWQWGSLVDGEHFTERSDIDLALEGVPAAETFFSILRDAEAMTRFPVDIVQIETIHPEYADAIRTRGRVVYGG